MKKINYVNTLMGTFNEPRYSNGNIYPIVARPFGMANFTIQTSGGNNWFYNPTAKCVEGIRLTHQPSPWVGDYGHLLILPFSGELSSSPYMRWSSYRPKETVFRPNLLDMYFQRYRIRAEITATERGGFFRFTGSDKHVGVSFITYGNSSFTVKGNVVSGWTESHTHWGFETMREYFYVEFNHPVEKVVEIENGGIAIYFATTSLEMKMATGFVSDGQTVINFDRELKGVSFDDAVMQAENAWEDLLSSVVVSEENPARVETFYSCLYRAFLYPRMFHEYDENGNAVHYNADTKTCEKGVFYTDNGFWDTYRTVYPLLSILRPELVHDMIEGFVNYSEETGWLPKWLSPGEIGIMPGTLVEAVISDACVKGIVTGELRTRAYKSLKKSAFTVGEGRHGREYIDDYMKYNYVPNDRKESVNHTCDCAYGDYCISLVAEMEGDVETAEILRARSKNYANLFDPETKFLRSKDREGKNRSEFNPFAWGGDNCEGGSWQNSFAVYHDIDGLIKLYGGKENFVNRLDDLFSAQPIYEVGAYGQEIHEMSEMACVDFGQMAISNQPSFHIPWLYVLAGERGKASHWVEKLVNEAFFCDIDGFPGDEDNGTTASWYVFACLGIYPYCPGKPEYACTKSLFDSVTVNGRTLKKSLPDIARFDEIFE